MQVTISERAANALAEMYTDTVESSTDSDLSLCDEIDDFFVSVKKAKQRINKQKRLKEARAYNKANALDAEKARRK